MLDYEMLDALWRSLSYLYIQCNSPKLIVCIVVLWHKRQKCIHSLIKHDCSHPCLLVDRRHSMKPWGGMCITSAVTHVNVSVYVFITLQPDFTIFGFIASCWSWDVHTLYFFFFKLHLQWHVSLSVERLQGVLPWLWTWKKCMAERLLHCYGNPNHAGSRDVLSQPSVSLTDTHILLFIWDAMGL